MSVVAGMEETSKSHTASAGEPTSHDGSDALEVAVVFTRMKTTRKAIRIARRLAVVLGSRVRLLVPHIVPFPVPLEEPLVSAAFLERRIRNKILEGYVETRIDIRLCRNRWQMLRRALAPRSIIVLVGPRRWWPTAESRLARRLEAEGHNVIFTKEKE